MASSGSDSVSPDKSRSTSRRRPLSKSGTKSKDPEPKELDELLKEIRIEEEEQERKKKKKMKKEREELKRKAEEEDLAKKKKKKKEKHSKKKKKHSKKKHSSSESDSDSGSDSDSDSDSAKSEPEAKDEVRKGVHKAYSDTPKDVDVSKLRPVVIETKTRAYEVPESVVDTLLDVYGETDKDKVVRVVTWTAQQLVALYSDPARADARIYYWGPTERAAFEVLLGDLMFADAVKGRMKMHIEEFEQFLRAVPPAEKYGYIDLPQFCRIVLAHKESAALLRELRHSMRRTLIDNVYVYNDFLNVVYLYACVLKKEEEYKRHGYTDSEVQRKIAKMTKKIGEKLESYDEFVVKLYWEIFHNQYREASDMVRGEVLERIQKVISLIDGVLSELAPVSTEPAKG